MRKLKSLIRHHAARNMIIRSQRTRFFRVDHRALAALRRTAAVGVLRLGRLLLTFLFTPFGSTILEPYLDENVVAGDSSEWRARSSYLNSSFG